MSTPLCRRGALGPRLVLVRFLLSHHVIAEKIFFLYPARFSVAILIGLVGFTDWSMVVMLASAPSPILPSKVHRC
jgi:hypothetical protein